MFFVPEKYRDRAYVDRPLPIGEEATISAPHIVAKNTELLEVNSSDRVVEIGSGSGYQVALLGRLASKVVGVELLSELIETSIESLEEVGAGNIKIVEGNGLDAVEEVFDRMLFSCAINEERFDETKSRLSEKGVIVAPVTEDRGQVLKKFSDGETTDHGRVRFVEYQE